VIDRERSRPEERADDDKEDIIMAIKDCGAAFRACVAAAGRPGTEGRGDKVKKCAGDAGKCVAGNFLGGVRAARGTKGTITVGDLVAFKRAFDTAWEEELGELLVAVDEESEGEG
jgi:hypothetical protein